MTDPVVSEDHGQGRGVVFDALAGETHAIHNGNKIDTLAKAAVCSIPRRMCGSDQTAWR